MRKVAVLALSFLALSNVGYCVDTQVNSTTYDKEELKKDYRAFLQQLKSLNAQYKEITGEISDVVKEEGVPSWDMGDTGILPKDDDKETKNQDLGGGIALKETKKDMTYLIDLPGYKKDNIKLSFQGTGKITLKASRKVEQMTRSYERTLDLPAQGDSKLATASYEDGVLTVKIPKLDTKEVTIPVR